MALNKFFSFLKNQFVQGTEIDNNNIFAAVVIGSSSHFLHYFMHKYLFNLNESISIRILATVLCLTVGFYSKLPTNIQKNYFPFYWHAMLIAALPMSISYMMIINHFANMWLFWMIFMPIALSIFIPNWLIFLIDLSIGLCMSFLLYFLEFGSKLTFVSSFESKPFLTIFVFSTFTGVIFVYGNRKAWLNKQKAQHKKMLSLTGSIVHEIRNPLNAISLGSNAISYSLKQNDKNNNSASFSEIEYLNNNISQSVSQANEIINIILSDIKEEPIRDNEFQYISFREILPRILETYGYRSEGEKKKVQLDLTNDCFFKAVPDRFDFIIYNLLKNALYYLDQYPNSFVKIGIETRSFSKDDIDKNLSLSHELIDREFNAIFVYDTGPGISSENISKLFDEFFTSGKKGGTGLGLSFCKNNMRIFGGDIVCESKHISQLDERGKGENGESSWTKFSLLFPKLSEDELKQIAESRKKAMLDSKTNSGDNFHPIKVSTLQPESKKVKILIVDDQIINLKVAKSRIEKGISFIAAEIANSGEEAIEMIRKNGVSYYALVLMDIQMPFVNGIETTKKIRKIELDYHKSSHFLRIPVIAYTSLEFEDIFNQPIDSNTSSNDTSYEECFDCYLQKPASDCELLRAINKMIGNKSDDLYYFNKSEKEINEILKGHKIILADDQDVNRAITKRNLELKGLEVIEAKDGKELVEIFNSQVSKDNLSKSLHPSKLSAILTDINMPNMSGDDASLEIRKIEVKLQTNHRNRIPIIALSGDDTKEDIARFFTSKMDDFFIKGESSTKLIKLIGMYIDKLEIKVEEEVLKKSEDLKPQNVDEKNEESGKLIEEVRILKESSISEIEVNSKNDVEQFESCLFDDTNIMHFSEKERKEFLRIFLIESDLILERISKNCGSDFENEDCRKKLCFELHALKGASGNIGAKQLYVVSKDAEQKLKAEENLKENWLFELQSCHQKTVNLITKLLN